MHALTGNTCKGAETIASGTKCEADTSTNLSCVLFKLGDFVKPVSLICDSLCESQTMIRVLVGKIEPLDLSEA